MIKLLNGEKVYSIKMSKIKSDKRLNHMNHTCYPCTCFPTIFSLVSHFLHLPLKHWCKIFKIFNLKATATGGADWSKLSIESKLLLALLYPLVCLVNYSFPLIPDIKIWYFPTIRGVCENFFTKTIHIMQISKCKKIFVYTL